MNWHPGSPDAVAQQLTWLVPICQLLMLRLAGGSRQSVMCDANVRRLGPTSFSIEDIIFSDDKLHQPHLPAVSMNHHVPVPVIVRPWEKQTTDVIGGSDETCLRLTAAAAAALTLCHWQAINSVPPLCALYKMTTSNFVHSLNADNLQGWGTHACFD